jgi:uncharacterized surface protein with fasciclin (FAS1) repeats
MRNPRKILLSGLLALGMVATAITQQQEATPQKNDIVATVTNVESTQKSETFKTFVSLVDKAGLTTTLKEPGPFTVLAPTDEAFEKLPPESLEKIKADPVLLKNVLNYHVIKGNIPSTDLKDATESETVQGEKLKIEVKDDPAGGPEKTITFNGKKAKLVKPDLKASNGVIHSIDAVLIPPSVEKATPTPTIVPPPR